MTINQRQWEKENTRLKRQQAKMEKRGYTFPKPLYQTQRPKRVTKKAIENLKSKRGNEYYKNAEYVVKETGEVITGLKGRKLEKQKSYVKGQANKTDPESYGKAIQVAEEIEKKYGIQFYEIVGTPEDILEIQTEEEISKQWEKEGVHEPTKDDEYIFIQEELENQFIQRELDSTDDRFGDLKNTIIIELEDFFNSFPEPIRNTFFTWWHSATFEMDETEIIERLSNMRGNMVEYVQGTGTLYEAMEKFESDFLNSLPFDNETREELEGLFANEQY